MSSWFPAVIEHTAASNNGATVFVGFRTELQQACLIFRPIDSFSSCAGIPPPTEFKGRNLALDRQWGRRHMDPNL